jgi:hypothetical protein
MHSYLAPTSLSEGHNRAQPFIPLDGPLVETCHRQAQPQAPRAIDERGLAECGPGFCPKEFGGDGKVERFLNIPLRIAELEQIYNSSWGISQFKRPNDILAGINDDKTGVYRYQFTEPINHCRQYSKTR